MKLNQNQILQRLRAAQRALIIGNKDYTLDVLDDLIEDAEQGMKEQREALRKDAQVNYNMGLIDLAQLDKSFEDIDKQFPLINKTN